MRLTGPETHRLADMAGVHMDLRTVAATSAQMARTVQREQGTTLELEAMQTHALVRYGRCFRGGVRAAFLIPQSWIDELDPDLRQGHRDCLDLRDKHVAHSVNDWEINTPVARADQARDR